jgi:hypothetical protein
VTLDLIFKRLWLTVKEKIEKTYIGKLYCTITITFTQKYGDSYLREIVFCYSSVIDTAVTKIGDFIVDFLRDSKPYSKEALTCVSRA